MAKRKTIDWDRIEKEFRLGQKSMRTLADEFGVNVSNISRRAKKYEWVQDKSEEVRQRTNAALLAQQKRNTPTKEDLETSVKTNIEVVISHRSSIQKGREITKLLFQQLADASQNRSDIESDIRKYPKKTRRSTMLRAVSLPSHASTLRDLSQALKNLIPLERQAFNLDEKVDGASIDDILRLLPKDFARRVGDVLREHIQSKAH